MGVHDIILVYAVVLKYNLLLLSTMINTMTHDLQHYLLLYIMCINFINILQLF